MNDMKEEIPHPEKPTIEAEFKLIGLSKNVLNSKNPTGYVATLQLADGLNFNAIIEGAPEMLEAMWNYCKGHWNDPKMAVVRYDYLNQLTGKPINPFVISIYELQH